MKRRLRVGWLYSHRRREMNKKYTLYKINGIFIFSFNVFIVIKKKTQNTRHDKKKAHASKCKKIKKLMF